MKTFLNRPDVHIFYSTFLRNFITLSLILFIPAAAMTKISVDMSTANLIGHVTARETELLKSQKGNIESQLTIIDNVANQILFDNDTWRYLHSSTTEPDYFVIKSVLQKIENLTYSNALIESIYFFDEAHDFVFDNRFSYKSNFEDKLVFDKGFVGGSALKSPRTLDRSTEFTHYAQVNITSYVKKLSNFSAVNSVVLMINLQTSLMFDSITHDGVNGTIYLTDPDYKTIFSSDGTSGQAPAALFPALVDKIRSMQEVSQVLEVGKEKYFVSALHSDQFGIGFIKVKNYNDFNNSVNELTQKLITSYALVLSFSLVLVLLLSFYLYRPLSRVLKIIRRNSVPAAPREKSEYALIGKTINSLFQNNTILSQKFQIAYGYLEAFSVNEFLINPKFNPAEFDKLLKTMGLAFPHSSFMIALFDCEGSSIVNTKNLKECIVPLFSMPDSIECLISLTRRDSIAAVINTNGREIILALLERIRENFMQQNIKMTIGLGESFDNISFLPVYYNDALTKMKQKFFVNGADVINLESSSQENIYTYRKDLQESLISAIKSLDGEKARKILDRLFAEHLSNAFNSVDYVKYVVYQIASNIYRSALALGGIYFDTELNEYQIYCRVENARHIEDMRAMLSGFVDKSIQALMEISQRRYSQLILQTVLFIEQNYTHDISLDDIAKNVHLSPNYLSNIFKTERGDTIFDTITGLRMNQATHLLVTTEMQIKEISISVGYNNVQSFIRYFKKYYGLTPEQYRKNPENA